MPSLTTSQRKTIHGVRDRLFIATNGCARHRPHHRCHLADHRRGVRTHTRRVPGRHRSRRRRGPRGIRQRPVAVEHAGGTGRRASPRSRRRCRSAAPRSPTSSPTRTAPPPRSRSGRRCSRRRWSSTSTPTSRAAIPGATSASARMGQKVVVRRAPVGVCAGIIPWNVPLFIMAMKLGPVPRVGLARWCSSRRPRRALDPLPARRSGARGRPPAGRDQHRRRVARGERAPRHATPASTRSASPARPRPGARIGAICGEQIKRVHARAGRQVRGDRPRRRRPRRRQLQNLLMSRADEQRPGLRRPDPHPRAAVALRTRWSTRSPPASARCRSAIPTIPPTAVGRSSPSASATRSSGCSSRARQQGAKVAVGGGRPAHLDKGWFIEPTVFSDVDNSMRIAREEIFGPVLSVIPYDDRGRRRAHRQRFSDYGLSGSVWTADVDHGAEVAARLRTGTVPINSAMLLDFKQPVRRLQEVGPRPRAAAPRASPPTSSTSRSSTPAEGEIPGATCRQHVAASGPGGRSDDGVANEAAHRRRRHRQ